MLKFFCFKKIKNKNGYTIPTALILMFLLFAFAVGILMFAAYNYNNAYKRHEKMQTYLYAKNILDECEYSIMNGNLNQLIADIIESANASLSSDLQNRDLYGQKYEFRLSLNDSDILINPYDQENISAEMIITYIPNKKGKKLAADAKDHIAVGDRLEIEYRIGKTEKRSGTAMNYQILSEYFCSYDFNKNEDGTIKELSQQEIYTNMRWQPFQYTGKIYTE